MEVADQLHVQYMLLSVKLAMVTVVWFPDPQAGKAE